MSQDNYIYINRDTLEVWECTASDQPGTIESQKTRYVGKGRSLSGALKMADEESLETEYGIYTHLWCK